MVNKTIKTIHCEIGANGGCFTVDYDNIDFKPVTLAVLGLVGLAAIGYPFIPVGL